MHLVYITLLNSKQNQKRQKLKSEELKNNEKNHQISNRSYSNFEPDQGNSLDTSAVISL